MFKKWNWWRAWLVQIAEMLALGAVAALAEPLGAIVYGVISWGALPLAGAVSAYRTTRRGLNNYLSWLAPPLCAIAAHSLIWIYPPSPGPVLLCALISLIGAAAGEVLNRETNDKSKGA